MIRQVLAALYQVVAKCEVGLDLHTDSDRRSNLPQIRADLDDALTRQLAEAFGAPVMLPAGIRDGSLRHAAREQGAKVLLYEAGESLRFDRYAIDARVVGVRRVLAALEMTGPVEEPPPAPSAESRASGWVRARRTGISTSTHSWASSSPMAIGSGRSSTPSARRCGSCMPTGPAS